MKNDDVKKLVEDDLEKLASMPVPESLLYKKWIEVNDYNFSIKDKQRIYELKRSLWKPENPQDYMKLEPVVLIVDTAQQLQTWNLLRLFISTAPWSQNPGRNAKYIVQDNKTKDYLGVISLGSDFIAIGGRDKYIGWTIDNRLKDKMLNYLAMGSSIVPTQPLGYSFVGGKLIALLVLSDTIENDWNKRYRKEKLAGITTTSLFGGFSQYNRLPYWRQCESSEGTIPIEPSEPVYIKIKEWMEENYPGKIKELSCGDENTVGIPTHPKNSILAFAFKNLKVKNRENKAPRGVYYAPLYENTNDFLSKKTKDLGKKKFDNSVKALTNIWKERFAKNRLSNVLKDGRYSTDTLFYDDLIGMSWEKAKEKYIQDVGR